MRLRALVAVSMLGGTLCAGLAAAQRTCTRDDFTAVVEQAAETLRAMTASNTPKFQDQLRALKDKRKWTHEQFLKEAAPFAQDERIVAFDEETNQLLNKIESLGEGGSGKEPDCRLLEVLRGHMQALVKTTEQKWAYMFAKIGKALQAVQ
jgi:hypothetical protein